MGRVELLIVLAIGLVYLTFPIITLVYVVQISNRIKRIEGEIDRLRSTE